MFRGNAQDNTSRIFKLWPNDEFSFKFLDIACCNIGSRQKPSHLYLSILQLSTRGRNSAARSSTHSLMVRRCPRIRLIVISSWNKIYFQSAPFCIHQKRAIVLSAALSATIRSRLVVLDGKVGHTAIRARIIVMKTCSLFAFCILALLIHEKESR